MKRTFITSAISVLAFTLMLGVLYPLVITGVSQVVFPGNANGQQITQHGQLVGSKIIGQQFTDVVTKANGKPKLDANGNPVTTPDKRYFQTRPSGTVPPDNAAATAFANLGPNDLATKQAIAANIQTPTWRSRSPTTPGLTAAQVPVDAVDTSASGIDPDISPGQRRHPGPPHRRGAPPPAGHRHAPDR